MSRLPILVTVLMVAGCAHSQLTNRIVQGARQQLISPANYMPKYVHIGYPNGDLPPSQGVCTDVVIRSLRFAGYDLQKLVHEDMKKHFARYPRREAKPDSNIDHRRVPNLIHFFKTYGTTLPTKVDATTASTWKPGDIVFWKLPNGLDHCGVISDRKNANGYPLAIHNMARTSEEDVLTSFKIVGHYRFPRV